MDLCEGPFGRGRVEPEQLTIALDEERLGAKFGERRFARHKRRDLLRNGRTDIGAQQEDVGEFAAGEKHQRRRRTLGIVLMHHPACRIGDERRRRVHAEQSERIARFDAFQSLSSRLRRTL